MALDNLRGRLNASTSRADLPLPKGSLNPAVMQAIADGFAIEHGQKITAEIVQQLTTANAQYYVSVARNARAEQERLGAPAANELQQPAAKKFGILRRKPKTFGFVGAGMAAVVVAIIVMTGGSDSATKPPTSLTNKIVQNGLINTTSNASGSTSDEVAPTDPNGGGIPASEPTTPTSAPTPSPAPKPTPTPVPALIPPPSPRTPVITTDNIVVTETIDFSVEYTSIPDEVRPGVVGRQESTYKVTYEDGVETSRTFVSSEVTQPPVNEVVLE